MRPGKWVLTGGAGFIGSNTARALADEGREVVVIDNLSRPSARLNLEWLTSVAGERLTFVEADVRDADTIAGTFAAHGDAEVVLHLAGQVAVTTSIADPREDLAVNAIGTFNVLEAVRAHLPDAAVLYASTNKVYGGLDHHRIGEEELRFVDLDYPDGVSETVPLDPRSPYGCSKATGDVYALDYARTYGLKAVSLRQSCIYGPRQFGVEDQGWVAWFAIAAMLGRPLTVYGTGKQVRDLLHVDDLVRLYLSAAERAETCAGRAFNVGGGIDNSSSLLELLGALGQRLQRPIDFSFEAERTADQRVFVCDIDRARRELDWRPAVQLEVGLAGFFDWIEGNADVAAELLATV